MVGARAALKAARASPLALLALLALLGPAAASWQYGIMIDAGSGGTRLHVFRWPPREADPMRPLYAAVSKPEELTSFAVKPGISSFANNITGLDSYMHGLLKQAEDGLQAFREQWYLIPVYLKATAGARDLYRDQRDAIFARIRSILFACQFRFDSEYWARTISGEEEAVSAWLTVNAIKGTYRADTADNTWGALDMGGASTQIVFLPKDVSIIQNYFPLHISYYHIHLYSHSYLEFGYRDGHIRLVRLLITQTNVTGSRDDPIDNPCMPSGVFFAVPLSDPFAARDGEVRWCRGTGDFTACTALAQQLLHTDARCFVPATSRRFAVNTTQANGACGINGIYEPQISGRKFVAIGQYAGLAQILGVPLNVPVSVADLLPGIMRVCSEVGPVEFLAEVDDPTNSLQEQGVHFKDPMSMPFARCWKVVWMFNVLHKGLRFPINGAQIVFAKKLEGQETGWALGAMMQEVNYLPWRAANVGAFAELPGGGWAQRPGALALAGAAALAAALSAGLALGFRAGRARRDADGSLFGYRAQLLV